MTPNTVAPQLTLRAIVLAIILAMILAAANTYLGLFAGLTIASAIPAAVVSMAVLRVLGGGGILENNIVQTGASAGSSIASGVIFTVPALVILGHWADFHYLLVLAIAGLLLAAWCGWFFLAKVSLYEVSEAARVEVAAASSPVVLLAIRPEWSA